MEIPLVQTAEARWKMEVSGAWDRSTHAGFLFLHHEYAILYSLRAGTIKLTLEDSLDMADTALLSLKMERRESAPSHAIRFHGS